MFRRAKPGGLLLFDPDCGFCTQTAQWLARRSLRCVIAPIDHRCAALGVDEQRARQAIPYVAPGPLPDAKENCPVGPGDWRVVYGVAAISAALDTGGMGWRILAWLIRTPPMRSLSVLGYSWVARNRHRLPGGKASCRIERPS